MQVRQSWCLVLCFVCAWAGTARADAPQSWVFLPALQSPDPRAVPLELVSELESAFRNDPGVMENFSAARLLASRSAEPRRLSDAELQQLEATLKASSEDLAVGDRKLGERKLRDLKRLSPAQRDQLHQEPKRAREVWQLCLTIAHLLLREGMRADAEQKVRECVGFFPGFRADGFPAELKRLLDATLERLRQEPHATLLVSTPREGCSVRFNGIELGKTPLRFSELRPGSHRVQVECNPALPARVHAIDLRPGENRLAIDPDFDAVLRTDQALWLAYVDDKHRATRVDRDAAAISELLGGTRVVLLETSGDEQRRTVRLRFANTSPTPLATLSYATGGALPPSEVATAVTALRRAAGLRKAAPQRTVLVPARLELEPPAAPQDPARREPEDDGRLTESILGAVGFAVGTAALASSWVVYANRRELAEDSAGKKLSDYQARGAWTLGLATAGSVLMASSEYLWLPRSNDVPTWAWIAGGVGVAVGTAGLAFAVYGDDCGIEPVNAERRSTRLCSGFTADSLFGTFVSVHALPLVSVPLMYLLRNAFEETGGHARLHIDLHGVALSGVF